MATCGTQNNGKMYLCESCPMDCSCSAVWRAKKEVKSEGTKNTEQPLQPDKRKCRLSNDEPMPYFCKYKDGSFCSYDGVCAE